jgi:ferritin-like metal-binding protein YciE
METRKGSSYTEDKKSSASGNAEKGMKDNLFHQLLVSGLKDIYWAEKYLAKSLPKIAKAATTDELKLVINEHLHETEGQVGRLESVFEMIGEKPAAKKCEAMEGLVDECSDLINETEAGSYTRDAALIMAAQKVEHYEIATYGTLAEYAKIMGHDDAAAVLHEILEEEKRADESLNKLAVDNINAMAYDEY